MQTCPNIENVAWGVLLVKMEGYELSGNCMIIAFVEDSDEIVTSSYDGTIFLLLK